MPVFIMTDTDDAMLNAMNIAADMQAQSQPGDIVIQQDALVELSEQLDEQLREKFQERSEYQEQTILERLDRGVPKDEPEDLFSEEMSKTFSDNQGSAQTVKVFSTDMIRKVHNEVNNFNVRHSVAGHSSQETMETIFSRSMQASSVLFGVLGHPFEEE